MKSLVIKGINVYCFDPSLKKYMKMGFKIGETFFKKVDPKHFMKVVNGYGLQYDAFTQFEPEGIVDIHIIERDTKRVWVCKASDWLKHGKIADYGRGKQIFLSLKYMHAKDKKKESEERDKKEVARARVIEDTLF